MSNRPRQIGNYLLEREIGRGASSEVWLARHAHLDDRRVAVKILMSQDREAIQRFAREASLSSRLRHPSIVQIYDHGHYPPFYCTIMEYIHGGSLRQLLEKQQRLDPAEALNIFRQIGAALDYAHSLGIIHRDVAPGNVLIEQASGRALLTDFGIARDIVQTITVTTTFMGTPGYLSPEHMRSATAVTHQSDIFGLGIVFYEMLSGARPWEDDPPLGTQNFPAPLSLAHRGVSNLPADVDRVIQTMIAVDPAKRFPTAKAAVDELERIFVRHQMVTEINPALNPQAQAGAVQAAAPSFQLATSGVAANAVESLLGADLWREPIARAHQRAEELRQPAFVAALLDTWAAQSRMRLRMLGRLARLHKVSSRNIYFFHLRVLYEQREKPHATEEPDYKAQVFPLEAPVDRWQVKLPQPKDFGDDTGGEMALPGSTRVVSCADCNGKGYTICPRCKGKQRILAPRALDAPPDPGPGMSAAPVSQGGVAATGPAPTLPGSTAQMLVPCPECAGRGGITCARCDGVSRLVERKTFRWRRMAALLEGNDDWPEVDEGQITKYCAPTPIYKERAAGGFRPLWEQVPVLEDLIAAAKSRCSDDVHVILSELEIAFIPISDICVDLDASEDPNDEDKLYKLTIFGFENYIPPDWRFFNWERVIFICLTGFLLLLVIIFGAFAFTG